MKITAILVLQLLTSAFLSTVAPSFHFHTLPCPCHHSQLLSSLLSAVSPGLFGFLFGAAVHTLSAEILPPTSAYYLQAIFYGMYASLYVCFVVVHLKRPSQRDTIVHVPMFEMVIGFNATMMLISIGTIAYEAVAYGSYPIVLTYCLVAGSPLAVALMSGDAEAPGLMARSLPAFILATPTFVAFLSAYNFARLADLTWGNRPTVSPAKAEEQRVSAFGVEDEADRRREALFQQARLERWLSEQMLGCAKLNAVLVALNLALMATLPSLLKSWAFLPHVESRRDSLRPYDGALELCVIFSAPWVLQLLTAALFHGHRRLNRCCHPLRRARVESDGRPKLASPPRPAPDNSDYCPKGGRADSRRCSSQLATSAGEPMPTINLEPASPLSVHSAPRRRQSSLLPFHGSRSHGNSDTPARAPMLESIISGIGFGLPKGAPRLSESESSRSTDLDRGTSRGTSAKTDASSERKPSFDVARFKEINDEEGS